MRRKGVTEQYWQSLSQDRQFYWKIISRIIAIVVSLCVAKIGILGLDIALMAFTAGLPMLIVENQRSYTRLSVKLSKRLVRICVNLASFGIMSIGMLYFSHAVLNAFSQTYQSINRDGFTGAVMVLMVITAVPIAARRVFKGTQYWHAIYTVPRQQLTKLLVGRRYKVQTQFEFYEFELAVLLACFLFVHMIALGLAPFLQIYSRFSGSGMSY